MAASLGSNHSWAALAYMISPEAAWLELESLVDDGNLSRLRGSQCGVPANVLIDFADRLLSPKVLILWHSLACRLLSLLEFFVCFKGPLGTLVMGFLPSSLLPHTDPSTAGY